MKELRLNANLLKILVYKCKYYIKDVKKIHPSGLPCYTDYNTRSKFLQETRKRILKR